MGESDDDTKRHREIDKLIRQDEKRMSKEVKLLLLGTCETAAAPCRVLTDVRCRRERQVYNLEADEADTCFGLFASRQVGGPVAGLRLRADSLQGGLQGKHAHCASRFLLTT